MVINSLLDGDAGRAVPELERGTVQMILIMRRSIQMRFHYEKMGRKIALLWGG